MNEIHDFVYWMALAHLTRWRTERINNLIIDILHNRRLSFFDFFDLQKNDWEKEFGLSQKEAEDILEAKSSLPEFSSIVENLHQQDFEIITIDSDEYSKTMKANLKVKYSPPVLYVKGNKKLLNEQSVAIIGSRDASEKALKFTDAIAKICVENHKIVVSGFAKGVDQKALESTLAYYGRSIIVLPQGIMTFASGIRKYHSQINDGDVLILSPYFPKAPWDAGLAMGRNVYIYGLAEEIYVAESNSKGGTWSGAIDGLRKGRKVYVRKPDPNEQNANNLLIEKGGIPVDDEGNLLESPEPKEKVQGELF